MSTFRDIYEQNIISIYKNQCCLKSLTKNKSPNIQNDIIKFNRNRKYQIQFIGAEVYSTDSFVWGWDKSMIPYISKSLLKTINHVKKFGEIREIKEFTENICLDEFNGHEIAIVVTALTGFNCYYKIPIIKEEEEIGAYFYIITDCDSNDLNKQELSTNWFLDVVLIMLNQIDKYCIIDCILNYLVNNGVNFDQEENQIKFEIDDVKYLLAVDDKRNKIFVGKIIDEDLDLDDIFKEYSDSVDIDEYSEGECIEDNK